MIDRLLPKKILVAGDLMLDVYTVGEVHRISPEAPVPVLRVGQENHLPGGAGNVMLNLAALGMQVVALGRVGSDRAGHSFFEALVRQNIDVQGIFFDQAFQTPLKNRMIASGQQIVRVDYETQSLLPEALEGEVVRNLPQLLEGVDVVAISDYAKGFLTQSLLKELICAAKRRSIPVVVDPKGRDFTRYRGSTLIKPNLSEAIDAAGLGLEATLDEIAEQILKDTAIEMLLVTRSREGISLFCKDRQREDFAASVHEVKDVTGAGDTVLSVITASVANQIPISEAANLANIAAGIAIEKIGCASVSLTDIRKRITA